MPIILLLSVILLLTACSTDVTGTQPEATNIPLNEEAFIEDEDPVLEEIEEPSDVAVVEQLVDVSEPPEMMKKRALPEQFVYLDEMIPSAQYKMGYYSDYNFVGSRIDGYQAPWAIAVADAAVALIAVSEELEDLGYTLVIYDAYRPQKAVDHFIRWAEDTEDTAMKESFYPNEDKAKLFNLGYLARKSGHSRGSTIDLTLAYANTGEEVDMGSPVDMLDEISSFGTKQITEEQATNRSLLKNMMIKYGFKPYSKEWWHYTLKDEPYMDTYFDFDVE